MHVVRLVTNAASDQGLRRRLLSAGAIGLGLSAIALALQVPRGWWPLAPIFYILILLGLAASPAIRHGHLVATAIATIGGTAGVYSFGALALTGLLRDLPPAWVTRWVDMLAIAFLVMTTSLLGSVIVSWRKSPHTVPPRLAAACVGLAAGSIAALEAGWLIRIHLG